MKETNFHIFIINVEESVKYVKYIFAKKKYR